MDLKTDFKKKLQLNKVTKSIKGNHKNYSVTKKSGIKRDMGRKKWDKLKIKNKMIELNTIRSPQMFVNPD